MAGNNRRAYGIAERKMEDKIGRNADGRRQFADYRQKV
jgi:hypothetical protein